MTKPTVFYSIVHMRRSGYTPTTKITTTGPADNYQRHVIIRVHVYVPEGI